MARPAGSASLLLLEAKNFRGYATENRARLASGDLATEVAKKALDSFGALHAGLRGNHQELRELAPALQPYPAAVHVVLLLEEDEPPRAGASGHMSTTNKWKLATFQKLRGEVLDLLQGKLKPFRITAALHSCADIPAGAGWSATTR